MAYLSQCKFVVVSVIEDVHKVRIEWVNLLKFRKLAQDHAKLFCEVGLGEFDLTHIERPDTTDLKEQSDSCVT